MKFKIFLFLLILIILPIAYSETSNDELKAGQDKIRSQIDLVKGDFIQKANEQANQYQEWLINFRDETLRDAVWKIFIAVFCGMIASLSFFYFIKHKYEKYKQDLLVESAPKPEKKKKK